MKIPTHLVITLNCSSDGCDTGVSPHGVERLYIGFFAVVIGFQGIKTLPAHERALIENHRWVPAFLAKLVEPSKRHFSGSFG